MIVFDSEMARNMRKVTKSVDRMSKFESKYQGDPGSTLFVAKGAIPSILPISAGPHHNPQVAS